ncbi:MAG TPA: lipopolysaccharide kinase InaA family protein [Candidatus Hydrogenedentes bacterium]|nr:lipopolysaccharide kinase InaA family protein [Candidatus Hydrogenedentota bacterium]HRK33135.1 lipopolysaccharide kinase InaA family protein [Candidatus Hydrogenedentota bacterium]
MDAACHTRYCAFERLNHNGFALRAAQSRIIPALLDRADCAPVSAMGRGALYRFPLEDGNAILREYRRGGAMQRVLRESFLTNRPLHEWDVLLRLREAGFPVPEPMGVVWSRASGMFRGAIATREVDAIPLSEYLSTTAGDKESVLQSIGKLTRTMHDLGVYHADLHVGNLLVARGNLRDVCFIDFDNARVGDVTEIDRARNLLRLRRSFVKRGLRYSDFERVRQGYGAVTIPSWLESLYQAKGQVSSAFQGRPGDDAV